jgi:GT2 family glycosyltransferase
MLAAPDQSLDLSIVVATRNRAEKLRRCLEAVAKIESESNWELVIVDNGSTDDTPSVLEQFRAQASFPVLITREPIPGLGRARNAGLEVIRDEIVCFLDDDCYPAPDYIDQVLQVFREHDVGYMGGQIRLFDPNDYPLATKVDPNIEFLEPASFFTIGTLQGANMAFRRSVLRAIGGFDCAFGPGSLFNCEDVDACARASLAGWRGGYFPGPIVFHHHCRQEQDALPTIKSHRFGEGAYFAKFMFFFPGARRRYLYRGLRRLIRTSLGTRHEAWWCLLGMIGCISYRWKSG